MSATLKTVDVHSRLRLLTLDALADLTMPPALVQGLIATGSLALLYGESNTGKSTLAMDLGFAIATGSPWRGNRTRRGAVVHVAGEGLYGLAARANAYAHHLPGTRGAPYGVVSGDLDLLSASDVDELIATMNRMQSEVGEKVELVILDTLARCAVIDENDGGQMRALVAACDRIRAATAAAVLVIHHAGKDTTKGARGHSSLRAAVDTELLVEGRENPRTLTVTKQRDLPTVAPMAFKLEAVTIGQDHDAHEAITACVVTHDESLRPTPRQPSGKAQQAILRALRNRQTEANASLVWTLLDLRKIGRDLGQHKQTARDAVEGLVCSGFLIPSVGGHKLAEHVA